MDYRLSLQRRDEMAVYIRAEIVRREHPGRSAASSEAGFDSLQSPPVYALEFFLDRYRHKFRSKKIISLADFVIGWLKLSGSEDEALNRLRRERMVLKLFMDALAKKGYIQLLSETLWKSDFSEMSVFAEDIHFFVYELIYELARELIRERLKPRGNLQ